MIQRFLPIVLSLGLSGVAQAAPAPACAPQSSSFEQIQRGIFDRHGCTMSFCHGEDRRAGLDLRDGNAYANLLGSVSGSDAARDDSGELKLVEPARPDLSLLWLSLAAKTLQTPNVNVRPMPQDALPLDAQELEAIRLWILAGAPEAGEVGGVAELICPPAGGGGGAAEDDSIADLPQCQSNDPTLLLPNLVPDPPADVRVFARNGRRRVEFTTRVGNTGDGPLIIQAATLPAGPGHTVDAMQVIWRRDGSKCVHRVGTMRLSEEGNRWQYGNWSDFELRRDDPATGPMVASSSKAAICLVDSDPIDQGENLPHQYDLRCTDPVGRMGISVGYKDTYSRVWPGQWIDLDVDPSVPIDRGTYYLLNIADPDSHLWEKNDQRGDNVNYTTLRLGLNDPDPPQVQPTPSPATIPPSQTTPTPGSAHAVHPHPTRSSAGPQHPQVLQRPGPPAHPSRPRHASDQ